MKYLFTVYLFCSSVLSLYSQELSQVSFSNGSDLSAIGVLVDRGILVRISVDGKIMEYGTELQSIRNSQYYAPRLQPYPGKMDFYGPESDSIFRGKPRSIGSALITYYGAYEKEEKRGKLKSIGTLYFDYFDAFDNKILRGRLRMVGNSPLQFHTSFDDPALSGKIQSVGNTRIAYYTSFDDKMIRGKIKTIGPVSYTWYTSLETQYGGGLKTGPYRQSIGGITYIVYSF